MLLFLQLLPLYYSVGCLEFDVNHKPLLILLLISLLSPVSRFFSFHLFLEQESTGNN